MHMVSGSRQTPYVKSPLGKECYDGEQNVMMAKGAGNDVKRVYIGMEGVSVMSRIY